MTLTLIHAAATWTMVGLIWFVQVVHYPLMARVGPAGFPGYEEAHTRRTGLVVTVPWTAEIVTAAWLLVVPVPGPPRWMTVLGAAALGIVVLSTVVWQVPAHQRLATGFDPRTHHRLVATNWVRTGAWTVRGVLAAAMVAA